MRIVSSAIKAIPDNAAVDGSGMIAINSGTLKPLLAKREPTPSGVNF